MAFLKILASANIRVFTEPVTYGIQPFSVAFIVTERTAQRSNTIAFNYVNTMT